MSNPFTVQSFPPNTPGTYTLTPVSGGNTVSGNLVTSPTVMLDPTGNYNLAITSDGYQDVNQVINPADGQATVQMIKMADTSTSGLPSGNSAIPANNPSTAVTTFNSPQTPEFIPPNADYGKYFMATDARMYIGNVFVDEVDSVQYVLQANQIPIYPYRASTFAAVGTGRSLVQGQIAINFISEGYLYAVLQNFNTNPVDLDQNTAMQNELNQLQVAKNSLTGVSTPAPGTSTTTPAQASADNQTQLNAINQRITDIVSSQGSNGAQALSTSIAYASNLSNADTTYCNAVYSSGPFDIVGQFTSGGRTVTRKLESCFLISNEQVVSRDGKILMDVYGFIARRLR